MRIDVERSMNVDFFQNIDNVILLIVSTPYFGHYKLYYIIKYRTK